MPHGQSEACIYCDMEQETIIYYYPMTEETAREENRYAAKKHWFQEVSLKTVPIARQAQFNVLGCPIPPFYYRRRPWKAQMLSEAMETVLGDAPGMTDTCLHPETGALLTEEYRPKWMPRESTVRLLVRQLLEEHAGKALARWGRVTVLLGQPEDRDRQMEMTWELLQPFLPRINRMLIYYEKRAQAREEEGQHELPDQEAETADTGYLQEGERNIKRRRRYHLPGEGSGGSRKHDAEEQEEEELKEYLEDYYYEYGLVPQLEPYVQSRAAGEEAALAQQAGGARTARLTCGKEKCGGMILDYGGQFRYPRILPEGGIYIDTVSVMEKELQLRRKGLSIPYLSPLKYLDTMVKNSYDGLVIKGAGIL
ncbi:MAG: hypothetical protein K2O13_02835 [Lachnospiraceae bacterium]|nr:hypothetical protein [Lachnospiraceae bacterium]